MSNRLLSKYALFLALTVLLSSCGASRKRIDPTKSDRPVRSEQGTNQYEFDPDAKPEDDVVFKIVRTAKKFEGTRYKYGGTNRKGMDCSGLVYVSFLKEGISLPRTSRSMSLEGKRLFLEEVAAGDLLFFETNKNRKVINHVGLVVEVNTDGIYFIHSSSSRGVIISSLSETYWKDNFVMARRVV